MCRSPHASRDCWEANREDIMWKKGLCCVSGGYFCTRHQYWTFSLFENKWGTKVFLIVGAGDRPSNAKPVKTCWLCSNLLEQCKRAISALWMWQSTSKHSIIKMLCTIFHVSSLQQIFKFHIIINIIQICVTLMALWLWQKNMLGTV